MIGARAALGVALAIGCALGAGCSAKPFVCASNTQCLDQAGAAGVCEPAGFCSFADATCSDSTQRYDSSAGADLAGTCVPMSANACITELAVGVQFACYLRTDGTVWCWGNNADGELGDGTMTDRATPTQVVGLPDPATTPVVSVSTAEQHACALLRDGEVWCWGTNDALNLGQCAGSTLDGSPTPVRIPQWTAGTPPTCSTTAFFTALVSTDTPSSTLSAGGQHTCALGTDNNVYCWGENTTGAEGGEAGQDFAAMPNVPGPLIVSGSVPAFTGVATEVQSGDDFTCLRKTDKSIWCWGGNQLGELASGGTAPSVTPVPITGFGDTTQLVMDDETACVLTKADGAYCWGNGSTGIFGPAGDPSDNAESPMNVATTATVFGGATAETVCVPDSAGAVRCWGDNSSGELGTGALTPINEPTPSRLLLSSIVQLRTGQFHSCAVTTDGSLWCWGDNAASELGNGTSATTPDPVPQRVTGVTCP